MNQIERVTREELAPLFEMMPHTARKRFVDARAEYRPGVHKGRYLSRKPPSTNTMVRTADSLFILLVMAVAFGYDIIHYGNTGIAAIIHAASIGVILGVVVQALFSQYRQRQLLAWLWSELTIQYFSARAGDAILLDQQNKPMLSEDATFIVDNLKRRYLHLRGLTSTEALAEHDTYYTTNYPLTTAMFASLLDREET